MKYMLTPYAKPLQPFVYWDDAFSKQELDWLQEKASNSNQPALVATDNDSGIDTNIRRSQVSWLEDNPDNMWVFEKLAHVVSQLNTDYYNFDLTGFGENLQLTNYDQSENGMYGWHQDYGGRVSRKFSLSVQLTDPSEYEGGNLQIMTTGEPVTSRKQRGVITAFPSYVLHQVTPVTQGSRQSLVAWVSGPAFK